jgi:SAM-dependent methyltransferase
MHTQTSPKELCARDEIREQLRLDYGQSDEAPLFRDPAFMENREVPVHRWVPWIAGFSASFVEDCFRAYLPKSSDRRQRILDPFAGVGTTIVSALRAGHDAVGFEINPYAALACRAKVEAIDLDIEELDKTVRLYEHASKNGSRTAPGSKPIGFESRIEFFSPRIEEQVHGFFSFLESVGSQAISDLFKVAFGSVMVSFSNYTYEPSLGTRPGAGKPLIEDADVHAEVLKKLRKMIADTKWLQSGVRPDTEPKGEIHGISFMESKSVLESGTIDLAVTSPPYLNNYHYIRSTRPHLYWLGLLDSRADLRKLEQENVGKYWQTVRGLGPIALEVEDPELQAILDSIRETRVDKGVYGGGGWANYAASYFNDSGRFLDSLSAALRPGGVAVIVIGNSIIQGHEIKVEEVLGRMAPRYGMALERIEMLRTKRIGASITKSSVRRGETSHASLYESAVILRRGAGA